MEILLITNLVPYPLDNGGKIKTFTTIKALSKEHTVDLVCFYEKENQEKAKSELSKYCRNIVMLPIRVTTNENVILMMRKALASLFTPYALSIYKYKSRKMKNAILEIIKDNYYDLVYFAHLQVYSYKKLIAKMCPNIKVILDEQNCESLIFKRYADESKNIIKKLYLYIENYKLRKFESYAITDTDKLIVLSDNDKQVLEKMCRKKVDFTIIPIGVNEPEIRKQIDFDKKKIDILFLGTLTWAPNNEGMIWFMQKVMPILEKKIDFNLYVVGKNPSASLKKISETYDNVTLTGYVESVVPYFKKCDFLIVPIFFGSGQRVKIIEAFSYGMPVISTSIGAEGLNYTDGKDILIADDEKQFCDSIIRLCDRKLQNTLSTNGRCLFEEFYSVDAVGKQINSVVNQFL